MQIGIIGLGRMGANMARRLARGGAQVFAFDRERAAREALKGEKRVECVEGLAALAAQLAGERGVRVTAILSARREDLAMAADLFESVGTVIKVLDTDGSSSVENVEAILRKLIAEKKADAFFTCGSNRLMQLMKRLGKEHGIPGQMAMEQIMACGLGPCYICVRTFEVKGKLEMRRVCLEGPVFDLQECLGW